MACYIYGKVKRKQNLCRILETDKEVYDTSKLTLNGVNYNPTTLIEDEESYQLTNFSNSGFMFGFLENDLDSVNHDQIIKADLKKLSYICTVQNGLHFFQIVNSGFYVSKKWFSIEELTLETDKPIITINPLADAIYNKDNDTLYFKKLASAQKIFKGMDQLYKEATDNETLAFLQNDFLDVSHNYLSTNVSVPNRKRIALVNETLSNFSVEEKQAVYDYTSLYSNIVFANGKFKIETDDDLKFVLWGIEQRFYTTPIGGKKRVANSIISI